MKYIANNVTYNSAHRIASILYVCVGWSDSVCPVIYCFAYQGTTEKAIEIGQRNRT